MASKVRLGQNYIYSIGCWRLTFLQAKSKCPLCSEVASHAVAALSEGEITLLSMCREHALVADAEINGALVDQASSIRNAVLDIRDKAITELVRLGMSVPNVVGLNVTDICWEPRPLIRFVKTGKERILTLGVSEATALRSWLEVRGQFDVAAEPSDALFLGIHGSRLGREVAGEAVRRRRATDAKPEGPGADASENSIFL